MARRPPHRDNVVPLHQRAGSRTRARARGGVLEGTRHPLQVQIATDPGRKWEAVIWAHEDVGIIGHALVAADVPLDEPAKDRSAAIEIEKAEQSLRDAVASIEDGPDLIVVDDLTLVPLAQRLVPDAPCSVGEVPLARQAAWSMAEAFGGLDPDSLRAPDIDDADLQVFVDVARALWYAAPWANTHPGFHLGELRTPELATEDAMLFLMGQHGLSRGIALFDDLLDFRLFTFAGDHEIGTPGRDAMPSHVSMSFDDTEDVPDEVRAELVAAGWDENLGVWPYPIAYERGSGVRRCTRDELHVLSAAANSVAMLAKRPESSTAPEPGTSLVVHLRLEGEYDWLDSRAAYPAPDLNGACDQGSFGDAPPIAYLARAYLEHRATKVQASTLNRDRAVLERVLASIEQVCTPRDAELPAAAPYVCGCESLGPGIFAYVLDVLTDIRVTLPVDVRRSLTVLRGFLGYLVRERYTQRGSDVFLLGSLELHIEEIIAGQEIARQLVKRMLQLSAEEDLGLIPETRRDHELPLMGWSSDSLFLVKRVARDRLWVESPDGGVSAPLRLPGCDFELLGLSPQWAVRGRVGRATRGRAKGQRVLYDAYSVLPRALLD